MQRRYRFQVTPQYQGYTLREYLTHQLVEFSPQTIKKMFHNKLVRLNQKVSTPHERIHAENKVYITIPQNQEKMYPTTEIPLEILYENEELLIVNKPSGIVAIPEKWVHRPLFKSALEARVAGKDSKSEVKIVFPLDKEASGVVIVAKDVKTYKRLRSGFEKQQVIISYMAIVVGTPPATGRIELKIAQASTRSNLLEVNEFGKLTAMRFEVAEHFRDFALINAVVEIGNSRRIPILLASRGFPLAVDPTYGYRGAINLSVLKEGYQHKKNRPEKPLMSRLSLHASKVDFALDSPFSVEAPLPKDFEITLKTLRKYRR